MIVLVIPDVHLKPWVFDNAMEIMDTGVADRAVCLMDIPDDWGREHDLQLYEDTFDAAIRFQKEFPDTLWCYGNHDLSYRWLQYETGFSPDAIHVVNEKLDELRNELPVERRMAYVHRIDNVLFVHGGITQSFAECHAGDAVIEDTGAVMERLNRLGRDEMWDDASPIWFRPQFSGDRMYRETELLQVVGHTPVKKLERRGSVLSCDLFSTYRTGKPIGTEEFLMIDTETWSFRGIN